MYSCCSHSSTDILFHFISTLDIPGHSSDALLVTVFVPIQKYTIAFPSLSSAVPFQCPSLWQSHELLPRSLLYTTTERNPSVIILPPSNNASPVNYNDVSVISKFCSCRTVYTCPHLLFSISLYFIHQFEIPTLEQICFLNYNRFLLSLSLTQTLCSSQHLVLS